MKYVSTRPWKGTGIGSAEAIYSGLSPSGGLFVPESFPALTQRDTETLPAMDYAARAKAYWAVI